MAPIDRPRTNDRWASQPTRITGTEATVAAADRCAMYSPSCGTELIRNIGMVAATVASVPVILVGWLAQRSLVRGLSMGAIK